MRTSSWEEALERRWWPKLRHEYVDPSGTSRATWTADQRRAFMIHHPQRTPSAVVKAYPAHLHINLLARVQRRGVGSSLLKSWFELSANREVAAAHVGVNRGNVGGIRFWEAHGLNALTLDGLVPDRTIWMGRS
jgi:ribosomal protein S18 acetylase RimI-like enzyme